MVAQWCKVVLFWCNGILVITKVCRKECFGLRKIRTFTFEGLWIFSMLVSKKTCSFLESFETTAHLQFCSPIECLAIAWRTVNAVFSRCIECFVSWTNMAEFGAHESGCKNSICKPSSTQWNCVHHVVSLITYILVSDQTWIIMSIQFNWHLLMVNYALHKRSCSNILFFCILFSFHPKISLWTTGFFLWPKRAVLHRSYKFIIVAPTTILIAVSTIDAVVELKRKLVLHFASLHRGDLCSSMQPSQLIVMSLNDVTSPHERSQALGWAL